MTMIWWRLTQTCSEVKSMCVKWFSEHTERKQMLGTIIWSHRSSWYKSASLQWVEASAVNQDTQRLGHFISGLWGRASSPANVCAVVSLCRTRVGGEAPAAQPREVGYVPTRRAALARASFWNDLSLKQKQIHRLTKGRTGGSRTSGLRLIPDITAGCQVLVRNPTFKP